MSVVGALGRGLSTVPGYGLATPYLNPAPVLASSAPGYYPSLYPYPYYESPAGAALRLLAGITAEQERSEQARHCVAVLARAQ